MDKYDLLLQEMRMNRTAVNDLNTKIHNLELSVSLSVSKLDKKVYSNKVKLSFMIAGISLCSSLVWAIIFEKIKTSL